MPNARLCKQSNTFADASLQGPKFRVSTKRSRTAQTEAGQPESLANGEFPTSRKWNNAYDKAILQICSSRPSERVDFSAENVNFIKDQLKTEMKTAADLNLEPEIFDVGFIFQRLGEISGARKKQASELDLHWATVRRNGGSLSVLRAMIVVSKF